MLKLSDDDDARYKFLWTAGTTANLEVLEQFATDVDEHLGDARSWTSVKHVCDAIQNLKTKHLKLPSGFGKSTTGYHYCWFVRCAVIAFS